MNKIVLDKSYTALFNSLKQQVLSSRQRAVLSVNKELIYLYYKIGSSILESQKSHGWGSKIIDQLSHDLKSEFPEMKGFSPQNLKYMRRFAESYCFEEIGQQSIDQLPWGHVITLIYDIHDKKERLFYVERSIENGWSRNLLKMQIETYLHKRQGKALTNFEKKLPKVQSDLAQATLKDPYIFDFLSLGEEAQEREIEKSLIHHMEKFLLELGEGFAFVGRQYHIGVGDQDFYLDLLFYHLKLRCFVVIELKTGEFKPEYAGKMNFYLSAVDDLIKHPADEPTIGLILCKTKNTVLAEYTLKDMAKPIGLSEYTLNDALPEKFQTSLPTVEEIESELLKRVLESESN